MKSKKPTKAQVRAARKRVREGLKVLRALRRSRRRLRPRIAPANRAAMQAQDEFYTWQHDLEILMPAVVRMPGADDWSAEEVAEYAVQAADRMKTEVAARRPSDMDSRRRRRRHWAGAEEWYRWESNFDGFVHALAARSSLDADAVIERAVALADAMGVALAGRRPKRGKRDR